MLGIVLVLASLVNQYSTKLYICVLPAQVTSAVPLSILGHNTVLSQFYS